ncbi:MAG: DUF4338 domain-containing protein, partial [Firmicutes bacterium]|nr:DUF4338 domain-containing protein [Bacillota bacterium]
PFWIGDRYFSLEDISLIRETLRRFRRLSRPEVAATLCENLPWTTATGAPRLAACHKLLAAIEAAQWMPVPPKSAPRSSGRPAADRRGIPLPPTALTARLPDVQPIVVTPVDPADMPVWNATMATYHPLGYLQAFGARQQYWIWSLAGPEPVRLGGLLFAAAAQKLQARDAWIGWDATTCARFRARIVNNSRFLILPGVHVPHLASHVLGLTARRIREDWRVRYGFAPVLLETFVEHPWRGTCYAAANWQRVGETTGRGRNSRTMHPELPKKTIWLYPLVRNWRRALQVPWPRPITPREVD